MFCPGNAQNHMKGRDGYTAGIFPFFVCFAQLLSGVGLKSERMIRKHVVAVGLYSRDRNEDVVF
jgi:hypothetical protein